MIWDDNSGIRNSRKVMDF